MTTDRPSTRHLRSCAITLVSTVLATASASDDFRYPSGARVLDVTTVGADPTGTTDSTAAIQAAIDSVANLQFGRRWLYFPDGTYRFSDTLDVPLFVALQGQSRDGTVLQLDDEAAGFGDPSAPKNAIVMGRTVNESFGMFLENLTIGTGSGNPGVIGLDYQAHNLGAIRNVAIRSGDGSGVTGLQLKRVFGDGVEATPGPHLVKDLIVQGFASGITMGEARSGITHVTFENITVFEQSVAGIRFSPRLYASIRGLQSMNAVPAITVDASFGSAIAIMDAQFRGGDPGRNAIELANDRNAIYLKDVAAEGYSTLVKRGSTEVAGLAFEDWLSRPGESLFESPEITMGLPVRETPDYRNTDFANDWQAVAGNDLQAAMDSGKPVVYLPDKGNDTFNFFFVSGTTTIPASVRWFHCFDQPVSGTSWAGGSAPVFRIEGTRDDPPLVIERFEYHDQFNFTGPVWEHVGSRTVVFKSVKGTYQAQPGAGDVFFEDYVGDDIVFHAGQKVWARQFNTEDATNTAAPLVLNNGASVWLLGHKTEGAKTVMRVTGGGRTEAFGGLFLPLTSGSVADIPLFDIQDGSFSMAGYGAFFTYPIHARESFEGETRELLKTTRADLSLFSAYRESYLSWSRANGLTGEDATRGADPDRDGTPNLYEFAYGGSPQVPDPAILPQLSVHNESSLIYRKATRALHYTVEVSEDLEGWAPLPSDPVALGEDPDGVPTEAALVPDDRERIFLRVSVCE